MNRTRKIQTAEEFAERVAFANGASLSHGERRKRTEESRRRAGKAHTHQPKRGEPGYVHRGPALRPDFRLVRAGEWGHEADAEHRLRWGLPG